MKKILSILIPVFVILGSIFASSRLYAQEENLSANQNRILIKFKENTGQNYIDRQINKGYTHLEGKIKALDVYILKVPENAQDKIITAFSKNPNVEYVESDFMVEAFWTPNDPYFESHQWGLENTGQDILGISGTEDADIDASNAWDTTHGGSLVAVLDSGVASGHPELTGKIVGEKDFTSSLSGANDVYGHGTHVAGIIAANTDNYQGVSGTCPNCTILNGKVLNDSGAGYTSWIAEGIIWAANNNAKVINMSLGSPQKSRTLENAINYAWNKQVVIVAAAGNSNNPSKTYPAAYNNVIAVAATNNNDLKTSVSSYSSKWVDIAAPGESIYSTWNDSTSASNPQPDCFENSCYKYASGTSMSTPFVSAAAGLVWATSYGTSNTSVRERLESTADPISGTGTYWAHGRLNIGNAVN